MATMNCQTDIAKELTVGTEFHLLCDGPWPENMDTVKSEIRLDPADAYKLKLLGLQLDSANKAVLKVTSYKAGEHNLKAVQIADANNSVVLGDLSFTVKSVLNPTEPEAEPYGPMGPITLSTPLWYYLLWAAVIALMGFLIWVRVRRRLQRQKLLEEIRTHDSTLAPIHQFNQQLRQMQRTYHFLTHPESVQPGETRTAVEAMEKSYRIFLARLLQVPALQWSDKIILADIKKHHRKIYDECSTELKKIFAEIDRALNTKKELSVQDTLQLLDIARRTTDKINRLKNQQDGSP